MTQVEVLKALQEFKEIADKNHFGVISYSKLSTLLNCPFCFRASYIKRYAKKGLELYTKATVGKFVHGYLERLAPLVADKYDNLNDVDADLIWASLLKSPQYSNFTQQELDEAESLRDAATNIGFKLGQKYNKSTHSFITEEFIGIDHTLKSFTKPPKYIESFITGYIDVLCIPKNTSAQGEVAKEALLLDYKTYNKLKDGYEIVRPQLELYALLLFYKYPDLQKINAEVMYVPDEQEDYRTYTREDLPTLVNNFRNILLQCEKNAVLHTREKWKGRHCEWCGYKYICD